MPAISKNQQQGAAESMFLSMTITELEHFAGTKHKGLPEKKGEK